MKGVSSPQPSSGLDQVHSLDNSTIKLFTEIGLAKIQSNFQDIMSKTNQTQASFVSLHQRAVLGACFAPKKKSAQASYLFHLFCNVKSKKWWRPSQARVLPEKKPKHLNPIVLCGRYMFFWAQNFKIFSQPSLTFAQV